MALCEPTSTHMTYAFSQAALPGATVSNPAQAFALDWGTPDSQNIVGNGHYDHADISHGGGAVGVTGGRAQQILSRPLLVLPAGLTCSLSESAPRLGRLHKERRLADR